MDLAIWLMQLARWTNSSGCTVEVEQFLSVSASPEFHGKFYISSKTATHINYGKWPLRKKSTFTRKEKGGQ